jgi:hypothetical protein
MSASEVSYTCAKIEFCHLSFAVNTIFKKRACKKVSLPAVMAGKGNDGILLFYIMLFVCLLLICCAKMGLHLN